MKKILKTPGIFAGIFLGNPRTDLRNSQSLLEFSDVIPDMCIMMIREELLIIEYSFTCCSSICATIFVAFLWGSGTMDLNVARLNLIWH